MVAGVMISTDGGATWHPVTTMSAGGHLRNLGLFVDCSMAADETTIETRAVDDAATCRNRDRASQST